MNPFRLNYKKPEDKVTNLFVHVLEKCGLLSEFIQEIEWNTGEVLTNNFKFKNGLQLHKDFALPVKHAFVLGISNTGEVSDGPFPADQKEGHPDAYFYDEQHQTLILVEVKVGAGKLYRSQLDSHKSKVKTVVEWHESQISWQAVRDTLKAKLNSSLKNHSLYSYIINNFIGVLNEEVIGDEYDEDYFIWIAQDDAELIKNLLSCLSEYHSGYKYVLPKGNHNEVRLQIDETRVFTFVLNQSRIIMHFGGTKGYKWRLQINENFGIHYDQGDKYQNELSIPFSAIDPNTLSLKPSQNRLGNPSLTVKDLIHQSFSENPKLRRLSMIH